MEHKLYGILGHPISGSLSPIIQNIVLERLGAKYIPFDVKPDDFDTAVAGLKVLSDGFNVTIPYKRTILRHIDELFGFARDIKVVNTVRVKAGRLEGFNTDVTALISLLKERGLKIAGLSCLIVGAGGAARAAVAALKELGCNDYGIFNRTPQNTKELIGVIKEGGSSAEEVLPNVDVHKWNILVNATPMGMYDDDSILMKIQNAGHFSLVIDFAYKRGSTRLANEAGVAISGLDLLIEQAAQSIKIWTGLDPDRRAMRGGI